MALEANVYWMLLRVRKAVQPERNADTNNNGFKRRQVPNYNAGEVTPRGSSTQTNHFEGPNSKHRLRKETKVGTQERKVELKF